MKVSELIAILNEMPDDIAVEVEIDGDRYEVEDVENDDGICVIQL